MQEPRPRPSFLSDVERQLITETRDIERVLVLRDLEKLAAALLQGPEALACAVGEATPEQLRKLGHKVGGVLQLLDAIVPVGDAEVIVLAVENVRPLVPAPFVVTVIEQPVFEPSEAIDSEPTAAVTPDIALQKPVDQIVEEETLHPQKRVPTLFNRKLSTLSPDEEVPVFTEDQYDRVVANLILLRGARKAGLDYAVILLHMLEGATWAKIAGHLNSTPASIETAMWTFFKKVQANLPDGFSLSMLASADGIVPTLRAPEQGAMAPAPVTAPVVPEVVVQVPETLVEPEPKTPKTDKEYWAILADSLDSTKSVKNLEWEEAAYEILQKVAAARKFSPSEINDLWTRIHYGTSGSYKDKPTIRQQEAIKKLQRVMLTGGKRPAGMQGRAVITFLNARGVQNLDDILTALRKEDASTSKIMTQRLLTDGVIKLLHA